MKNITPLYIEKLCEYWCLASTTSDGNIELSADTEKFRLLRNGVLFHDLDHDALCATLIGLSKVLLRPNLNSVVDYDHTSLWAWCGEILVGRESTMFSRSQIEIENLYKTVFHSALAPHNSSNAQGNGPAWFQNIQKTFPHHAQQLIYNSGLVLAYLAFPLLEAILKRSCSKYLSFDGKIISSFSVKKINGDLKNYDPRGRSFGSNQCSSMRDMLFLHYNLVADASLKSLLDAFRTHLSYIDSSKDPYDTIYGWRNQSMHGSANFSTIGGIILNLAILISVYEIRDSYGELRERTIFRYTWNKDFPAKAPWSFYPLS